ncbi:MAG: DUF4861 family protein [Candidatus Latescibacter sp.]|nr:DUF4861 family protein [Candidatus Latescibacter sp.]
MHTAGFHFSSYGFLTAFVFMAAVGACFAQKPDDPAVRYAKKFDIVIANPLALNRPGEPVVIPLSQIMAKAPDFNRNFFRVKYKAGMFEPLDIPSQIRIIPDGRKIEELVFQVDLGPSEKKTVELQYNLQGSGLPAYPARTQSFEKWYTGGVNIAWENELVAYRSYSGLIDFFGKSYAHLRLQDLPPDSYHHERLWGVDPFVIGKKPGLCGVMLFEGNDRVQCYGGGEGINFIHKAESGGPVCAGAVVAMENKGGPVVEESYSLYAGRYYNEVRTVPSKQHLQKGVLVAPGMQKNDKETVQFNEKQGYLATQVLTDEYGAIGLALIWNPGAFAGMAETNEGRFIKLKPSPDGSVKYLSMGVWYRGSAEQPASMDALVKMADELSQGFRNPLQVEIGK